MWTCVPSAAGMNEIVDCPPSPISHLLFLLQSVILLACSLNDSRCMPAIVCMYYWTFQGTLSISHKVVSNFCHPMDCSLPLSSVRGIFQARVLEWVAISFSRGSSQPRDWTWVSQIVGRRFTAWATREVHVLHCLPEIAQTPVHWEVDSNAIHPFHPLSSPSPPAFNLSQHQGLFLWISPLYQVAKVLEL